MSRFFVVQDSISTRDFEQWRFAPYDKNILFNFKGTVESEEEAITLVVKCYGKDMMGVRRLNSRTIPNANWIIMKAYFSTEGRLRALKDGITIAGDVKSMIPRYRNPHHLYSHITGSTFGSLS
ncbi:hypothetical protein BJV82DRAFT_575195 [Fennellomyces sp. T-0311]|nr:hypothetical protein BJV82DRAFT_575195 [Fennellomyces sp. T-0311]